MRTVSGVFAGLDSAERLCRKLEALGIGPDQLSLTFDDHCPACAVEQARVDQEGEAGMGIGQGLGALLGLGVGLVAVFWPMTGRGSLDPLALGMFDWILRLVILGSWTVSGMLFGGMLAAAVSEGWTVLTRPPQAMPAHAHVLVSAIAPEGLAAEVAALIRSNGGRLAEPRGPDQIRETPHDEPALGEPTTSG